MIKGKDYIGVSVGAMVMNGKGEFFFSKRGGNVRNERGTWEFPGGGVRLNEKLADAVRREMMEEYGVEIEIVEQFPAADHLIPEEGQHWVATTFVARLKPGQEPKIMEPDKCEAIGWFSLDNPPQPLSIITRIDIKTFIDYGKTGER